jgi:hypothetical protein
MPATMTGWYPLVEATLLEPSKPRSPFSPEFAFVDWRYGRSRVSTLNASLKLSPVSLSLVTPLCQLVIPRQLDS